MSTLAADKRVPPVSGRALDWRQARLFAAPFAVLATFAAVAALALILQGIGFDGRGGIYQGLASFATVGVAALYMRMLQGTTPILAAVEGFAIHAAISIVGAVACAAVGIGDRPYIDGWLVAADRALFPWLDWPAMMQALPEHPRSLFLLTTIYTSLTWQPIVFFAASLRWGSTGGMVRCVAMSGLALLLCVLPFHWLPAQGAYVYFGIAANDMPGLNLALPWVYPEKLALLREGVYTLNVDHISGLITFPSYHAAAAVIMARAFWDLKPLRWPMLALNAAMFLSAAPIGGHYFVDLIAGALIAATVILTVDRLGLGRVHGASIQ